MSGLIQNLSGSVLNENLQGISDVLNQGQQAGDEQARPLKFKTETSDDGRLLTTVTAPHEEILKIQEKMKLLDQILGSFHDRSSYLQAQEQRGRDRSPILQALSSVAGNLAAGDKRLPPIVQALGRANLEMNPSQQVLGQRAQEASFAEAGIIKEQAGLAQASAGLQIEQERVKEQGRQKEEQLKLSQERIDERKAENFGKRMEVLAQKNNGVAVPFKDFVAAAKAAGIKDPERIQNLYAEHESKSIAYKRGLDAEAQRRKENAASTAALRVAGQKDLEETKGQIRLRVGKELANLRAANTDRLQTKRLAATSGLREDGREMQAYGKVQKGVEAVVNVKDAASKLRQLISDNPEAVGVIEGRIPEWAMTKDQAKVRAEFFTMLDAVRQQISGGTRFWNPQEFKNLSPKLAMASKTERANLGILDALDDFADRQGRNIVRTSPYVAWDKISDSAFGAYKEGIFGQSEGSGPANPNAPALGKRGAGKAEKKPDFVFDPKTGKLAAPSATDADRY